MPDHASLHLAGSRFEYVAGKDAPCAIRFGAGLPSDGGRVCAMSAGGR
jgi:hypothetical protein